MVHIKESLLLIIKSSPCNGSSRFSLSIDENGLTKIIRKIFLIKFREPLTRFKRTLFNGIRQFNIQIFVKNKGQVKDKTNQSHTNK